MFPPSLLEKSLEIIVSFIDQAHLFSQLLKPITLEFYNVTEGQYPQQLETIDAYVLTGASKFM